MSDGMKPAPLDSKPLALPEAWTIATAGYASDGDNEAVAGIVDTLLRLLANHGSDLRSLDGVTLTVDCQKAAAQLQNWPDGNGPSYRKERGHVIEMARTVPVWRGAELRFHIVLQAAVGAMMLSQEHEDQVLALSCLAHEAAHVEHEGNLFRNCPHVFGGPLQCGERSSRLFLTVMDTWSEYAACRSSAFFRPEGAKEFDNLLHKAIQEAIEAANVVERTDSLRKQNVDDDNQRQQMQVGLFVYSGYLFGHFDGLPFRLERNRLKAMESLKERPEIHALFLRLHEALRELWLTESHWSGLDVFFPLHDLLEELIGMGVAGWRAPRPFVVPTPRNTN